jgi:murein DD-endopeptidase MepM/ murein hydrolase activator NlpD
MHANTPKAVTIMPPAAPEPNPRLSSAPGPSAPGAPQLETATSRALFVLDQRGGVTFSYRTSGAPATAVEITLLRVDDGSLVRSWSPTPAPAGSVGKVSWNGLDGRAAAPDGRYAFRMVATAADGAAAQNASAQDARRDAFDLRPALFPVKGRHNFGGSEARFGAARSGHIHQGQDVLAACGTPLRAARGGVVKAKQYQSAAGYYLVIDGQNTGIDQAYMHLRAPSPYKVGDRVYTGDQIGVVGDTGDATACHLHFEEWTAPGWYSGGSPFDPLADLKYWDGYS